MNDGEDPLVLTFQEGRNVIEEHASKLVPPSCEMLDLLQSAGRVLAEPILADRDIPPFARSTRDGYAVRSSDLEKLPAHLVLKGEIKAGPASADLPSTILPGETFSIMTGAPVPPGADAVVMIEYTSAHNGYIEIAKGVAPGENIVAPGAEARRGSLLISKGTRLNEAAIALAASVGKPHLPVFHRPRIAVLATGDEIVELQTGELRNGTDHEIGPTQIRNSNSYSLAVQIQQAGGDPVFLPIAPDEPARLRQLIEQGLQSDLLLMTGGVSMGRYDLVEPVLAELRAEFFFTGAKIQPGRPAVFGRAPAPGPPHHQPQPARKYFFGLPGNPVSTMVTFELFARPMIEALAGMAPRPLFFLHALLKSEVRVKPGLTRFLPAILSGKYEATQVELVPWQGSGDIAAASRSNCYLVVPPERGQMAAGEWVAVMLR